MRWVATALLLGALVAGSEAYSMGFQNWFNPWAHTDLPARSFVGSPIGQQANKGPTIDTFSDTLSSIISTLQRTDEKESKSGIGVGTEIVTIQKDPLGGVASVVAFLAAIAAGIATLIAFVVPPLQMGNQILAIIAIALLLTYIIEDKRYWPDFHIEHHKHHKDHKGYYGYDSDYGSYGFGYGASGYKRTSEAYPYEDTAAAESSPEPVNPHSAYSAVYPYDTSPGPASHPTYPQPHHSPNRLGGENFKPSDAKTVGEPTKTKDTENGSVVQSASYRSMADYGVLDSIAQVAVPGLEKFTGLYGK